VNDANTESAEVRAFRERARQWLTANVEVRVDDGEALTLPVDRQSERAAVERARTVQRRLFDAGLAGITWPKECGGQGLPIEYHRVFWEEAAGYDLGTQYFMIAFGMVGPTILQIGTDAQQARYIPAMLRGEETWCQLFSEPNAGSDVASLQTRAVRDGDEWVVNGQKVWTSGAHRANLGALLARTNSKLPKHQGLTMLIVDMAAPGVEVRPLRQATGDAQFNEVFFDDVRVPLTHVLGEVDGGWRAARTMLMNERVAIGTIGERRSRAGEFDALRALAVELGRSGDPVIRQALADIYVRERLLAMLAAQVQAARRAGKEPGPGGSVAKLARALFAARSSEVGMLIAGSAGQAWDSHDGTGDRWARAAMSIYVMSVGGGTNEIQRNILGERVLGLPRDVQIDRDVPFQELLVGTQRSP
jgi:alkylation response protein AidB-like acyl-CoA dehydrogenase